MQKLKDYQFRGRGSTYDWDTILDGSIYRLTAGEDFTCASRSLNHMARNEAKKRGGRARVSEEKDADGEVEALVIQFVDGGE
jgi:hypothetical protein